MGIFGGIGTVWGPIIGSICLTILIELLWVRIPYFHAIIFSLLVIVIVIKVPGGLIKIVEQGFYRSTGRDPSKP